MTSTLSQTPNEVDLTTILAYHKKDILLSINCHAIATIQSFNPALQTVEATINYKQTYVSSSPNSPDSLVSYPVIVDCPVIILSGGHGSLSFPIAAGDTCLLLFNDRDIDNWFVGNNSGAPESNRLHSFADAIALVGLNSLQGINPSYDPLRVVLKNGTTVVKLGSLIKIANTFTDLKSVMNGTIDLLDNLEIALTAFAGALTVEAAAGAALTASIVTLRATIALYKTTMVGGLLGDS